MDLSIVDPISSVNPLKSFRLFISSLSLVACALPCLISVTAELLPNSSALAPSLPCAAHSPACLALVLLFPRSFARSFSHGFRIANTASSATRPTGGLFSFACSLFQTISFSREGQPRARSPTKCPPKFQQPEQRIGCKAHMKVNICSKGVYQITSFVPDHNHATTTPTKTKLLKSHRQISKAQKAMGDLADAAGIKPKETYELLAKQVGGRRHLTFIPEDYKNYLRTKRERDMALGDAGALMQYFQDRQKEDPSFYYAIQLDNDDQITNIFWADGRSLLDYEYFGDVLCFDTTYKTNDYGRRGSNVVMS